MTATPQTTSLWGCSPDGKWLYYTEEVTNGVLRVSAGGGKPELVPGSNPPNSITLQATLSPDGKTLAILTEVLNPESKNYSNRIVLASLGSGVRNLDLDPALKAVFRSEGPARQRRLPLFSRRQVAGLCDRRSGAR